MTMLDIPLGPDLTEEQARETFRRGEEATLFALLNLAQMLAKPTSPSPVSDAPSTPSSSIPPYEKPTTKRRGKKRGRKEGHPGSRRAPPKRIDRRLTHT